MLIDGANEADSENIIDYMKNNLGVSKLDYVIATHPDTDHIAGLDKLILAFDAECIYMPITTKSNKEMNELYQVIENRTVINPTASDYFYLGNSKCTILNSGDTSEVSDNNSSIVLQLDYGETSCLFMGDAETEVEDNVTLNDIDVLKVSHHGSNDATGQLFLEAVLPKYSIISVGSNNSHNHPSSETLNHKYYQIPQELFINPLYKNALNSDSKLLYGFLLDRLSLSIKNNWHDKDGNVYLIFTRKEVQDKLNLSDKTVTKAFKQLSDVNLIYEKKQGFSKPKLIYVAKIQHQKIELSHNRKNYDYINGDSPITESEIFRPINTNNNYTYKNNKANKNSVRDFGRDYPPEFLNGLYANV